MFWLKTTVASDNAYLSSQNGVIFTKDKTVLLWYPKGKPGTSYTVPASVTKLEENSFRNIDALTSVTLPNGLKHIASYVFYRCPNIATLNLPVSLEFIGDYSIRDLKMSSMVVPEKIKVLNHYALSGCDDLVSVELPSRLEKIMWSSFAYDYKLKTVTCKAANPPVIKAGQEVFEGTPIASATLRVPAGSKALYQAAEGWKDFGTIVEF
ncbi:leucine-rich repeat domain-containing protein [Treponema denticola]|uniref:leucine-rich repeat domain-containing protein n=1 Tax=Treponema denticola TaxID=158 RepID=UPI00338DA2BE